MSLHKTVQFSRKDPSHFFKILNRRINTYFKENNIKKTGNRTLYIKTAVMFSLLLLPYFFILFADIHPWWKLALAVVCGIGMAGTGMNVMHDGNHGSYSSKKWLNSIMGGSMYILSGNVYNWQVQHNVLHHTYTNIHGHDEDLDAGRIIRFSDHAQWRRFHKFQHYYSFFLYGFLTLKWIMISDFRQMHTYLKRKLSYGKFPDPATQWSILILTKILYATIWIVIPMLLLPLAWWQVLLGFFVMHYTASLILSLVFQLAHVVQKTDNPLPDKAGTMKNTWVIHQLHTTTNFSTKNKWINWLVGGLNHQVEHHIFPNISHIHYSKIATIVKATTKEFNLPYHEYKTTRQAVAAHFRYLKALGKKPAYL